MRADVVIVGDGIVSLSTALILAKHHIDVVIIKPINPIIRKPGPTKLLAISLASCRLFQKYGLVNNIPEIGQPINAIEVLKYKSHNSLTFLPQDIDEKNFGYFIDEIDLLNSLKNNAIDIKEIKTSISNISQNNQHISIELKGHGVISAKLLIIADGKNSKTRKMCAFQSVVRPYNQVAMICNISHEKHHHGIAREIFMPMGPFAMLPEKSGYNTAVVWTLPDYTAGAIKSLSETEIHEMLSPHCIEYLGEIKISSQPSVFDLTLNYSKTAVNQRAALAGDAFHSIHPLAGQGLNLGLRDVELITSLIIQNHCLGLDIGSEGMLSLYDHDRTNDARAMIEVIGLIDNIYKSRLHSVQFLGSSAINLIEKCTLIKEIFINHAVGNHLV